MRCRHCGDMIGDSAVALDSHYRLRHPDIQPPRRKIVHSQPKTEADIYTSQKAARIERQRVLDKGFDRPIGYRRPKRETPAPPAATQPDTKPKQTTRRIRELADELRGGK